ncbi:MAG: signal peptidase I [Oscillospiraceae bacterium]|jgi:signal peptidase I|nr:signal peptidase I [Oscillospiraceae bacterium]
MYEELTPGNGGEAPKKEQFDIAKELYEWAQSLVSAIVGIVLVFVFIASVFSVRQYSMQDTLQEQDMLLISNLFYTPKRGDIVMFSKYGVTASYNPDTGNYSPFVKRVIGLPGDEISYTDGVLRINGEELREDYIREQDWRWSSFSEDSQGTLIVPEGQYFLMGDNRNASRDSRSSDIGFVDRRCIIGRVLIRLLPLNRIGTV